MRDSWLLLVATPWSTPMKHFPWQEQFKIPFGLAPKRENIIHCFTAQVLKSNK